MVLRITARQPDRDALPLVLHGKATRIWGDESVLGQKATTQNAGALAVKIWKCTMPRPTNAKRRGNIVRSRISTQIRCRRSSS